MSNNIQIIETDSFQRTILTYIDLPNTITEIGANVFLNINTMKSCIIRAVAPPTLGLNAFAGSNRCIIYVPDESVEDYKVATNWSAYTNRIKPLSDIEGLTLKPFSGSYYKIISLITLYDGTEVTPAYTIEGTVATIEDGVLIFSEMGEVTVTATYNGESVSRTYSWDGSIIPIENGVALQIGGKTTIDNTMSTVGFVTCYPSTQIEFGVHRGVLGTLCEYTENGTYIDYWGGSPNPRTITTSANCTKIKASFGINDLANAYIYDVTNGVYLWKGDNVES